MSACTVGPDYQKPDLAVPAAYKENVNWKPATPGDALQRGAWWEIFSDPVLNDLEAQIEVSNQSLKQAEAQYRQAAALVSGARANFFPTVGVSLSAQRAGRYGSGSVVSGGTVIGGGTLGNSGSSHPTNTYSMPFTASWEPDLWGRVRRTVEGDVASAQASEATLESTRLSLHAELAQTYFQLRIVDEQKRLLDDTVAAYQKALDLTQNQYNVGVVARADVVQADTQLKTAQVQAIDLGISRAQFEHAIALLVGKTPAEFSLAAEPLKVAPPRSGQLPATLLERRRMSLRRTAGCAASAQSASPSRRSFEPDAFGRGGFQSSTFSDILAALPVLVARAAARRNDLQRRRAPAQARRHARASKSTNYRQVSLAAFQNVGQPRRAAHPRSRGSRAGRSSQAAETSLTIALNQYRAARGYST
jgi:NodT family efflux transporter outer membrane factor (OMF) lipoprotein